MDLFSRSGFGTFFSTLHALIRRFGLIRSIITSIVVVILITGLFGSSMLVQKSQEIRRYAADNMCNVDRVCDGDQAWINGWIDAHKEENKNAIPTRDEMTNAHDDQNNNAADGNTQEVIRHAGESGVGDPGKGNRVGDQSPSAETIIVPPVKDTSICSDAEKSGCGGANQGYCVCGGAKDKVCNSNFKAIGGDCVPLTTVQNTSGKPGEANSYCKSDGECGSGLICSGHSCSAKPTDVPIVAAERYGITDNICNLPGANCGTDMEKWRRGFEAARGDVKALAVLKDANPTVFSSVTVDGGIVKTTQAATPEQTKALVLTQEVATKLEPFKSQCSEALGLCPMIDPKDGKTVVGWVPSKVPLFGTFEDAKLARLNISIGDLSAANTPEYGSTAIRSATEKDFQDAIKGVTADDIRKWKAQAEKDQLQVGNDGQVIKDKDGNILTATGTLSKAENARREDLFKTQELDLAKKQDAVVDKLIGSSGLLDELAACIKNASIVECTPEKIKARYSDALKTLSQDRQDKIATNLAVFYSDFKLKHEKAVENLLTVDPGAFMAKCKEFNGSIACGNEDIARFTDTYKDYLESAQTAQLNNTFVLINQKLSQFESFIHACSVSQIDLCEQEARDFKNKYLAFAPQAQKKQIEDAWKIYETKKLEEKMKADELANAQIDIDKKIQDEINDYLNSSGISKGITKEQLVGRLVYGTFDTTQYVHLSDAEKKKLSDEYTRKVLIEVKKSSPSDLAASAKKIAELEANLGYTKIAGNPSLMRAESDPAQIASQKNQTDSIPTLQQQFAIYAQNALGNALVGGMQNIERFNNLSYNQAIRNKAADYGYGADDALTGTGRLLNTVTNGGFGQYASAYANVNAQNPDATYLNKAFNTQGMDATSMLIAKTATQFALDKGTVSTPMLNGLMNAPLIGPTRWAGAVGLGLQADENVLKTGDLSQIGKTAGYNLANLAGITDLVTSSNRLFYQIGMTPEEASTYRNSAQCGDLFFLKGMNPFDCKFDFSDPTAATNRFSDALTVGSTAVSFGDIIASAGIYEQKALVEAAKNGIKNNPTQALTKAVKQTFTEGTLAQKGFEQGLGLFAQGYAETKGSISQKILGGTKSIYDDGMPNTQKAVNVFLDIIGKNEGRGGGGNVMRVISQATNIGVMPDSHSMPLDKYKEELLKRGIIDAEGNPLEGVILGDFFGKTTSDLQLASSTLTPGNDLLTYTIELANRSNGKIHVITGNWEPRATTAVAAALRGDTGQFEAILSKTLPETEVQRIISSPENIREYINSIGQLKTVVKIGDTVFSHTDTAQELLYSLNADDLQKLAQTNSALAEDIRYLLYQQKYSGVNSVDSYGVTRGIDLIKKSDPNLAQQVEQIYVKYSSLPKNTVFTPEEAEIIVKANNKMISKINSDKLLTADEVNMFGQAYAELGLTPEDITDRINANVSSILTGGVEAQIHPQTALGNPGNLSNATNTQGVQHLQNAFDLEAAKAYRELQVFHNNISEGEGYWRDGGYLAQAYADVFDANQLAFGHTPVVESVFKGPMQGIQKVSPGVYKTGGVTLYDFDTNVSTGMQSLLKPTEKDSSGFLPVVRGVMQLPEDRSLLRPIQTIPGPTSIHVNIKNNLPFDVANDYRILNSQFLYQAFSPYINGANLAIDPNVISKGIGQMSNGISQ